MSQDKDDSQLQQNIFHVSDSYPVSRSVTKTEHLTDLEFF